MENKKTINFLMKRIVVDQFAILSDIEPKDVSSVKFGINISFRINANNNMIVCKIDSVFKDRENLFMKLYTKCYFAVHPTDWITLKQSNSKVIIPMGFLKHIAMHSIGTTRGILHVKTESTPFNSYIIPPVNVDDIIKNDLIIE